MKFEITQEQLQAVANYLIERPFKEVFQLIQMVQALPPIMPVAPPKNVAQMPHNPARPAPGGSAQHVAPAPTSDPTYVSGLNAETGGPAPVESEKK